MFLSTPPSRVATNDVFFLCHHVHVSIHATLAGGDYANHCGQCFFKVVSIHATLAGGDSKIKYIWMGICVSIHATLAGGDIDL